MSFDLVPAELLASALTAVMLAIPVAFVLAGAAISGRRRTWNTAGLAMGMGLLLGVLLAAARLIVLSLEAFTVLTGLVMLGGLLCAVVAAVLVIVLVEGTRSSAVIGALACALVGFGEPNQTVRAVLGISSSPLVVVSAIVIEAVALAAIVGFLVAGAGRVRAMQIGVAAAGIVSAVLLGVEVLSSLLHDVLAFPVPAPSLTAMLIVALVALAVGAVVSGVVDIVRSRRQVEPATSGQGR